MGVFRKQGYKCKGNGEDEIIFHGLDGWKLKSRRIKFGNSLQKKIPSQEGMKWKGINSVSLY